MSIDRDVIVTQWSTKGGNRSYDLRMRKYHIALWKENTLTFHWHFITIMALKRINKVRFSSIYVNLCLSFSILCVISQIDVLGNNFYYVLFRVISLLWRTLPMPASLGFWHLSSFGRGSHMNRSIDWSRFEILWICTSSFGSEIIPFFISFPEVAATTGCHFHSNHE